MNRNHRNQPDFHNDCVVCSLKDVEDPGHLSSQTHIFNFMIWQYSNYRKALVKDRNGIELTITPLVDDSFIYHDFKPTKGKSIVKIAPIKLQLLSNKLEFQCKIKNISKSNIFITSAYTLRPSPTYCLWDTEENLVEGTALELLPRAEYVGIKIKFHLDQIIRSSFRLPICINLQNPSQEDPKFKDFSICRCIVIDITDENLLQSDILKSPFTNNQWEKKILIIAPNRLQRYPDKYPIPQKYDRCLKFGLNDFQGMSQLDFVNMTELTDQLKPGYPTKRNYRQFFHILLWLDEVSQKLMLQNYNMENVHMKKTGSLLELEVPGLAEKRPSVLPGDFVLMRVHNDHTAYMGIVKFVNDSNIQIEYVNKEFVYVVENSPNTELDVSFVLGRLPLERMHEGIDKTVNNGLLPALFPSLDLVKSNIGTMKPIPEKDYKNKTIVKNSEQRHAVDNIFNGTSQKAPYIVFGPPGTGKTVTIVEAIVQLMLKTDKKILICAPANAACDMLCLKLMNYCSKEQLIRINSENRDIKTIPKHLLPYCNYANEEYVKLFAKDLTKYRIVVSTLVHIGGFRYQSYQPDYLFIDEAGQAREPEACIAIGLLKLGKQIVLAGDPKQLGPVVFSKVAAKYKLDISILERLMNEHEIYNLESEHSDNFITKLKKNYRSHPKILEIPNRLFYGNELVAVNDEPKNDPIAGLAIYPKIKSLSHLFKNKKEYPSGQAVEFCSVSSKEEREGRSPSYFNIKEAQMVLDYIKTMVSLNINKKVEPVHIGVVTPYIRQVHRIQELLKRNNLSDVEVGTTETFQGREKRIIIISTVRAQHDLLKYDRKYNLGFVRHDKRFNVAITRAQSKLVIIGCPMVLGYDVKWYELIQCCQEMKSFFGAPYERRTEKVISETIDKLGRIKNKRDSQ